MNHAPVDVFRRLTTGIYVIGAAHRGRIDAFTAAWLMQVSFDPLIVALSVNPSNASYPLLVESGAFVVNVLASGQLDVAARFGTRSGRDADKLAGVQWHAGQCGAPILADAAAFLECRIGTTMPAGDHVLVVGEVVDGGVLTEAVPLRYDETGNMDGSAPLYPETF